MAHKFPNENDVGVHEPYEFDLLPESKKIQEYLTSVAEEEGQAIEEMGIQDPTVYGNKTKAITTTPSKKHKQLIKLKAALAALYVLSKKKQIALLTTLQAVLELKKEQQKHK